jgi:hypothetical protein
MRRHARGRQRPVPSPRPGRRMPRMTMTKRSRRPGCRGAASSSPMTKTSLVVVNILRDPLNGEPGQQGDDRRNGLPEPASGEATTISRVPRSVARRDGRARSAVRSPRAAGARRVERAHRVAKSRSAVRSPKAAGVRRVERARRAAKARSAVRVRRAAGVHRVARARHVVKARSAVRVPRAAGVRRVERARRAAKARNAAFDRAARRRAEAGHVAASRKATRIAAKDAAEQENLRVAGPGEPRIVGILLQSCSGCGRVPCAGRRARRVPGSRLLQP